MSSHPPEDYDPLTERLLHKFDGAWIGDDGHVRDRVPIDNRGGERTRDLTVMFQNAPRKTANVEALVIEAELYAERGTVGNPAEPITDDVEQRAREQLDAADLTPAWEAAADD